MQRPRHFVVRFTDRVVAGAPDNTELAFALQQTSSVCPPEATSAIHGYSTHARAVGIDMAGDMMRADEREIKRHRQALGRDDADEQGADQSRTLRYRDGRQVSGTSSRFLERLLHNERNDLHMLARSDLGHDAAEPAMRFDLAGDDIG